MGERLPWMLTCSPGRVTRGPGSLGCVGGGGELNPAETLSLHPTNAPGLPEASSRSRSNVAVGRGQRRVGLGRFLSVGTRKHEQMVWPRETGCQLLGVTEAARPTRWPQRAMPLRGPGGTRARPEAPPPEAHSTRRPRPPPGTATGAQGTFSGGGGVLQRDSARQRASRRGGSWGEGRGQQEVHVSEERGRTRVAGPVGAEPPPFDPGLAGSVLRAPPTRHTPKQPRLCPHCFLSPVTPTCTSRPAPTQSCLERRPDHGIRLTATQQRASSR